ncbi:MAG: pyruvate kinase, partial [Aureliella sp.]
MSIARPNLNDARTKIVATMGPACEDDAVLVDLVNHGVDIFRINAAHGTRADFEKKVAAVVRVREATGFPVAILLDLAGPKIRLGQLVADPLEVEIGRELFFVRGDRAANADELCSNYARLLDEIRPGDKIMLADGTISLQVVDSDRERARCRVLTAGTIRSRQGINLPGVTLSVSAMRPEDVENAIWAARNEIDFISLSFVRSAQDVASLKNLLASLDSHAMVIAKIEKREALADLEAIVEA